LTLFVIPVINVYVEKLTAFLRRARIFRTVGT
jgi:hypothetical protein